MPPSCACCGAEAARSDLARRSATQEIIVGYCDDCKKHQGSARAKSLSGGLASGLVGLALALALPLAPSPLRAVALALVTLTGALVPLLVVAFVPRRPRAGHAADGPAVRFVSERELLCADERWGTELARLNGVTRKLAPWREARFSLAMFVAPVLAPALAVAVLHATSPILRVVNLAGDEFVVEIDGTRRASLRPTSVESATSGAELRVPAGDHELVARALDGSVLERARVVVESGRAHLFAPASVGQCFWLETVGYGRSGERESERQALEGPPHFWSLPDDIGGWFSAPPEAELAGTRSTGGTVTVLRHAPCAAVR